MTQRTKPNGWKVVRHPTKAGYYSLIRQDEIGQLVQLANRISQHPPIEAFATREQAERVAGHLAKSRKDGD